MRGVKQKYHKITHQNLMYLFDAVEAVLAALPAADKFLESTFDGSNFLEQHKRINKFHCDTYDSIIDHLHTALKHSDTFTVARNENAACKRSVTNQNEIDDIKSFIALV